MERSSANSVRADRSNWCPLPKSRTVPALPPLDYLAVLSDDVGVIQHAVKNVPNRETGYCTDDIARAFMVALAHARLAPSDRTNQRLASNYLAFLHLGMILILVKSF